MEITRLRSFVILAERLHFGQTAELLNLSQPALSKQIRLLESEIGAPLFNRDRHGVNLTEAGRSFLKEARSLVQHFDEVYEKGKRIAQGQAGTLSIGFGFSTVTVVPRLVSRFRAVYPNVEIKLQDLPTFRQIEGLQTRRIDVGFGRLPVGAEYETRLVLKDELVLALPESYSGENEIVNLSKFKDKGFIMYSRTRSDTLYDHVLRVCAAYNFYPNIIQETYEMPTTLALVAAGLGVALVPQSDSIVKIDGVISRKLDTPFTVWQVGAIWRRETGQPLTEAFLKVLDEELGKKKVSRKLREVTGS